MRQGMRAALGAALMAAVLPAAAQAEIRYEVHKVPTVDGAEINVELRRDDQFDPQPVLLTYSPYNTLSEPTDGTNLANDGHGAHFNPQGIARAVADVLGTRNSSGCWDYGGRKEQQSGVDLVKHLAKLPWSNGKVAMIGGSYDGTTATMVAARGDDVPELKAIVPIAAISRWYGYAYGGGVRYFLNSQRLIDEGFDTPLAFDFGIARTPPTDPSDPAFAEKLRSRANPCESVEHTLRGYDTSPDYDTFWLDRDYRKDAGRMRAAALIAHGLQDFNVKQEEGTALFEALAENPGNPLERLYLTQGTHSGGTSGPAWRVLLDRFLRRYLLDERTGIERMPAVHTTSRTLRSGEYENLPQTTEPSWPPDAGAKTLWIRRVFENEVPGVTLPDPGTGEYGSLQEEPNTEARDNVFTWIGAPVSEEVFLRDPLNKPGAGHGYYNLSFTTDALETPLRVAGEVVVDGHFRGPAGGHLTPVLYDEAPDGTMRTVARGFLNLDYRNGLDRAEPADRQWVRVRLKMLPIDFTFQPGHRIGLMLQSANTVWAVPGTPGPTNVATGPVPAQGIAQGSKLVLPLASVRE